MATSPEPDADYSPPSSTHGERAGLIAAGLFVLAFALVPLFRVELYPFSRAPMFADAPQRYCEYSIVDPAGNQLDLQAFDLQRNYWGNPLGVGVGFEPPPSLDHFGQAPSATTLKEHIQERLADFPQLPYVDVSQREIRDFDGNHVDEMDRVGFRLKNSHFRSPAR
jgi:hypothetical protein